MPRTAKVLQSTATVVAPPVAQAPMEVYYEKPKKVLSAKQLEILRLGREKRLALLAQQRAPQPTPVTQARVAATRGGAKPKCNHCNKMVVTHDKKIVF
jgi:hypothetical protein